MVPFTGTYIRHGCEYLLSLSHSIISASREELNAGHDLGINQLFSIQWDYHMCVP